MLLIVPIASAQDGEGLSDDELALLDRAIQAVEIRDTTYTSYIHNRHSTTSQSITVALGALTQTVVTLQTTDETITRIGQGEDQNVQSLITAQVENRQDDTILSSFIMNAEVRIVDGTIYVQAWYDEAGVNAPELPEGWVIVDDIAAYPAFSVLDLEGLNSDGDTAITDNPEMLRNAASSVSSELTEDGEAIAILIQADGMQTIFESLPDTEPMFITLLESVDSDDQINITYLLNEDGSLAGGSLDWQMTIENLSGDLFGLNQLPEGATITFAMESALEATYSQVNDPALELTTAPEM